MTRYFFHCRGARDICDEIGTELPNARAAQLSAIGRAQDILVDHPGDFTDHPLWRMVVVDEMGRPVFVLGFNAVVLLE